MNGTISLNKKAIFAKAIIAVVGIAAGVALPQIFHAIGLLTSTGAAVGSALLPMHIPVLFAGFVGGAVAGMVVGVLSPVVSFLISGMPAAAILPFMIIELGVYGLAAGLLSKSKLNSFVKLIIVQLAGRAARIAAVLISIYAMGNTQFGIAAVYTFILDGLFGIVLQWVVVPLALPYLQKIKRLYE